MKKKETKKQGLLPFDFLQQVQICVVLIIGGLIIGNIIDNGFLLNICGILSGALFLINPVWPENLYPVHPKRGRMTMRTVGLILLLIGTFATFRVTP